MTIKLNIQPHVKCVH